jgi:hypothetical protein
VYVVREHRSPSAYPLNYSGCKITTTMSKAAADTVVPIPFASHTSATNCARLYHRSFSRNNISPSDWPVGFALIAECIWDSFTITCLLDDNAQLGSQIIAPNTGLQKDRFTGAIEARSLRFHLYGQPELSHRWDKCLRIFHGEEAWVVVVDAA